MSEVYGLLCQIAQSETVEDVWDLAVSYFGKIGFRRVNYGYTRFRHATSIGDPDDALFLSSNSHDYALIYFNEGFYSKTPMYRWVSENNGAKTWRWVEEAFFAGTLPRSEAEAVRQNREKGVIAGISISFPETSTRRKGAMGLMADHDLTHDDVDRIWAELSEQMMAVAHMMHLKITQLPNGTRRRPLTDRQREALEWVADGKTTQDIALLMEVSIAMVEKHLRLARESLDVETTAQAVAKGALLNMIFQQKPPNMKS